LPPPDEPAAALLLLLDELLVQPAAARAAAAVAAATAMVRLISLFLSVYLGRPGCRKVTTGQYPALCIAVSRDYLAGSFRVAESAPGCR